MKKINLKGLNEVYYYEKLKSGLDVYMWVNDKVNTYYATLSVKYGSIYNKYKVNNKIITSPHGVAHFLEHIKFNENKDYTAHDYFNKMGSDTNAFTTFHYTNYQVFGNTLPKENITHLLDFVFNDYFTKKMVQNEKGIIVEEARMGEDDPYSVMLFHHLDNIFYNYEHKYVITGTPKEIKSITLEDIKNAYNYFYHPENMFLVVTGNFNPLELIESLRDREEGKVYNKYLKPERIIPKEKDIVKKSFEEININVSNKKIKIGIKINKNTLNKYDDLHIRLYLSMIFNINFSSTSDFKDMLLSKELISDLSYAIDIFDDYITIMFTIDSEYSKEVIELFNEKLDNLDIDEKSFIRKKKANIASLILSGENVEVANMLMQNHILRYGHIIDNIKSINEKITYKELLKFNKDLNLSNRSILILNPLEKK